MRVDGYGASEMASFKLVRMSRREDRWTTPGGVNMQPDIMRGADGGKFGKGIVGAKDGCAGCSIYVKRRVSLRLGLFDLGIESGGKHATHRVSRNGPDCGAAKTKHLGCFFDTVVTVGASEKDELAVLRRVTMLLCVREQGVAGDDYGGGVRGRSTLDRDAACVGSGKAEEVGEGARGCFFDKSERRRDLVNVNIGVEKSENEFRDDADGVCGGVEFV